MITFPPPAPPAPPKRTHRVRNTLLIVGGFIGACMLFSVVTNPAAVKDGYQDGLGVSTENTIDYKHAESVIPEEDLLPAYPGYPSWVNDESIAWSEEVSTLLTNTSDMLSDFGDASNEGDVDKASSLSVDVYLMWLDAPDAPEGIPIAPEYNAMRESVIDTFAQVSTAMTTGNYAKLNDMTGQIAETVRLMGVFTEATDTLTSELEALG